MVCADLMMSARQGVRVNDNLGPLKVSAKNQKGRLMSEATVENGKVVIFHYTLKNEEGEVLDTSDGADPMPYLHGYNNIVPGLEEEMQDRKVGDSFEVEVSPEKGYGVRDKPETTLPREQFEGIPELSEGMQLFTETPDGDLIPFFVSQITEDEVVIDFNHPLSDVTLYFSIEITAIRDANAEEIAHGHPHGIDGTTGHGH